MGFSRCAILAALVLTLTATGSASAQQKTLLDRSATGFEDGVNRPLDLADHRLLEQIVQVAYDSYELYVEAGGRELDFAIRDFRTFQGDELAHVFYGEVIEFPGGLALEMARGRRTFTTPSFSGLIGLWFDVEWAEHDSDHMMPEAEWRKLETMSLDSYIRLVGQSEAGINRVEAVTAYRVHVAMEGQEREYRAAFFWAPESDGSTDVIVMDHIVQGVESALRESEPPTRRLQEPFHPAGELPGATHEAAGTCFANYSELSREKSPSASGGHRDGGSHRATGNFDIACTCTTSCRSECSSTVSSKECKDSTGYSLSAYDGGVTCHKMSEPSFDEEIIIKDNGDVEGATCGAVVACAMKGCYAGCFCSASISVSISRGEVSMSNVDGEWSQSAKFVRTCMTCEENDTGQPICLPNPDGPPAEMGSPNPT